MNPSDIPQWLAEHGGAAGPPVTNANSVTTHRAADGSYVNVFNGRVTMIGHDGAAGAAPEQMQPAAPASRPGGGMNQQEVEAWIAANGGPGAVQYVSSTKTIDNPAADVAAAKAAGVPFNPMADPKITVKEESWVNSRTGAVLRVSRKTDGSFDVIENKQADPNKPAAGVDTRTPEQRTKDEADAKNAAELQRQREKNAALPADQDPAYETDKERRDRAEARIKQQGEDARRADADRRAEADRNKPSVTIKEDGAGGFVSVQTFPDGRTPVVTPIPGIKGTPAQIKEGGVTYERQPDGTYKPAQGIPNPNTPEPEGAPKPSFTVGDAAADLQKYQEWLNAEMRKPGATLTAARADQLLEARRKLWDTALSEQAGIVNAQQQAYRDQLTQRGQTLNDQQSRRNSATSIANQAQSSYGDLMDKMGANPGGASIAKAIQEARFNAAAFVDNLSGGGVPEIKMGPAYEQTNQMQLNPRAGAGAPVPAIPQPGAPTPTANALGVGAVGNVPAPTGAPAPAPAQPVFRPAPVAPAAPASAPQPAPLSPGQSGMMSPVLDSENPPVPQSPGQAGMMSPVLNSENPPAQDTAPIFAPVPSQAVPGMRAGSEAGGNVQMAPMQPAPWFLAGSSNGRAYDPTPAIASLIADPNIDNDMLRQAVALEYPGYDVDSLLGRRSA